MPPLVGHKKSRRGCIRCKERRVKCDEQQPCRNCIRRGESCSLLSAGAVVVASQQPSPVSDTSLQLDPLAALSLSPGPATTFTLTEWTEDLMLMHHYTAFTSISLSRRESIQKIWKVVVPEEASRHAFLMHGVLALSALHLCHLRPLDRRKYTSISVRHQSIATSSFRIILPGLDQQKFTAAFVLASIISVMSMSVMTCQTEPALHSGQPSIHDIIDQFNLTKGIRQLLDPGWQWIRESPISDILEGHSLDEHTAYNLPIPIRQQFDMLANMLPNHCDASGLAGCKDALAELENLYKDVLFMKSEFGLDPGVVIKWMTLTSADYDSLLRIHHPPALVLLAHYAILFKLIDDRWYINGWSEITMQAIEHAMTPDWQIWLTWPKEQMKASFPDLRT